MKRAAFLLVALLFLSGCYYYPYDRPRPRHYVAVSVPAQETGISDTVVPGSAGPDTAEISPEAYDVQPYYGYYDTPYFGWYPWGYYPYWYRPQVYFGFHYRPWGYSHPRYIPPVVEPRGRVGGRSAFVPSHRSAFVYHAAPQSRSYGGSRGGGRHR